MANEYTLHPTVRVMRQLGAMLAPELNNVMLTAIMSGQTLKLWAVYVTHDMSNCEWRINKVEPWDAYEHINSDQRGIIQTHGRDELDAYIRAEKALGTLTLCETY